MKLAVLVLCALCVATSARKKPAREGSRKDVDGWLKGKREAGYSYPGPPRSSHVLQLHGGSSLNIGAGYSLGGSKPSFSSYPGSFSSSHFPAATLGLGHTYGGHYQPITANVHSSGFGGDHSPQPTKIRYTSISGSHKNPIVSGGKFGSFLSSSPHFAPQSFGHSQFVLKPQMSYGTPHYAAVAAKPEVTYTVPANFMQTHSSLPAYAAGTQGLGAYASSSAPISISGPLFVPANSHETPTVTYGAPTASFAAPSHGNHLAAFSFGGSSGGHAAASSNKFAGLFSGNYKPAFESQPPSHGTAEFKPSLYLGSSEPSSSSSSHEGTSYSHQAPLATYGAPISGHSSLLSAAPIYISPKAVADALKASGYDTGSTITFGSQGGDYHGSTSLTGTHEIASAGHSAPVLSFAGSSEHFASPSVTYGTPSDSHDSGSGGYTGGSVSHISYDTPTSGHTSISSSFGGFSSNHGSPAVSYTSSPSSGSFGSSQLSSNNYNAIGSFGKGSSFPSHGTSSFTTSNLSDNKESYTPQNTYGPPKGSYSTKTNVYTSPPSENKYDTIKYSRDISEGEILRT